MSMRYLAIDTNLLVLYVVGTVSRPLITRHKRLKAYTTTDFDLLSEVVVQFDRLVATPNALTETSNLVVQGILDPLRANLLGALKRLIDAMDERYCPSIEAASDPEFLSLGVADSAWLGALEPAVTLITDDLGLYLAALRRGANVQNFTHMRAQRGGF